MSIIWNEIWKAATVPMSVMGSNTAIRYFLQYRREEKRRGEDCLETFDQLQAELETDNRPDWTAGNYIIEGAAVRNYQQHLSLYGIQDSILRLYRNAVVWTSCPLAFDFQNEDIRIFPSRLKTWKLKSTSWSWSNPLSGSGPWITLAWESV